MKYSTAYYADIFFLSDPGDGGKPLGSKKILIVMADNFNHAVELATVAMKFDEDVITGTEPELLRVERFAAYGLTADNVMR